MGFINQEQIALLELTFRCVCWISWYMYSHIDFCKVNDAEPNKLYAKEANYVAFVALPIRTIEQSHSNYCFFLFFLLLLLLFMLCLLRLTKGWPISILLTARQRGNVTLSHILQFATGAEEEPVLGFIKNWLTFLNFSLFNQNIVNSQVAMTVNYDKASPSAHM